MRSCKRPFRAAGVYMAHFHTLTILLETFQTDTIPSLVATALALPPWVDSRLRALVKVCESEKSPMFENFVPVLGRIGKVFDLLDNCTA
jgi:hypothetical protein